MSTCTPQKPTHHHLQLNLVAKVKMETETMKKVLINKELNDALARPRGADATASILSAALELGEEVGFDALTIEGIADRTGVAKTTMYRRWPNVSALGLDA